MSYKRSKRNVFQRIMGKPATIGPADADCWQVEGGNVRVDLTRAPELNAPYGAISLEGRSLPVKLFVMRDGHGDYRALENKCAHAGRSLDPVPGTETVCCCSLGKNVFSYDGDALSSPDLEPIKAYPVAVADGRLTISLN